MQIWHILENIFNLNSLPSRHNFNHHFVNHFSKMLCYNYTQNDKGWYSSRLKLCNLSIELVLFQWKTLKIFVNLCSGSYNFSTGFFIKGFGLESSGLLKGVNLSCFEFSNLTVGRNSILFHFKFPNHKLAQETRL